MKHLTLIGCFVTFAGLGFSQAEPNVSTIAELQDCVAYNYADRGYSGIDTCWLASGVYIADGDGDGSGGYIEIGRSVTIQGTSGDPSDVIIQRGSGLGALQIMAVDGGGYTVTIENLTIDGNRNNLTGTIGLCTNFYTAPFPDLDLEYAGVATVESVDFISAPWDSLWLGTGTSGSASTVSYSNFGQGFSAHGISRTAQQTASRDDGVWLGFSVGDSDEYTGAWFNNIAYSGGAAIVDYEGTYHYAVGNNVNVAGYEQPSAVSGGQIYSQGLASYMSYADNVVNGNYWYSNSAQDSNPASSNYTLCLPDSGLWTLGFETSDSGDRFYNNSVIQNLGFGIILRPFTSTQTPDLDNDLISGYDPFCPSYCTYVAQYIDSNAGCRVYSCYPVSGSSDVASVLTNNNYAGGGAGSGSVTNIAFDHIRVTNSGNYGISFNNTSGVGFEDSGAGSPASSYPYACFSGNYNDNIDPTTSGNSLTNSTFTNSCP